MQLEPNVLIENPGPNEGKYKSYDWQIANRNNMIFYQKGISGSTMKGAVNSNGTDKGDISKKNFSAPCGKRIPRPCVHRKHVAWTKTRRGHSATG